MDVVRPAHCPACRGASQPVGSSLRVHGHGLRERVVMGILGLGERPVAIAVECRRYLCACGCVMLVGPADLSDRRRYTLVTIAVALAKFATGAATTALRAVLAPGGTFEEGWPALRRWTRAIREGRLLRWIRGLSELSGRRLAECATAVLAEASGVDSRRAPFEARVVAGVLSCPSS